MKVLGIEIKGRELRLIALEMKDNIIEDVTGSYKPIKLEDDDIADNVLLFRNSLFAIFDSFNADVIAIKWRNPSPPSGFQKENNFSSSPISFKIEGLIQTYEKAKIILVKSQSITAFLKKNPLTIKSKYAYQDEALKVAFYQLKKTK